MTSNKFQIMRILLKKLSTNLNQPANLTYLLIYYSKYYLSKRSQPYLQRETKRLKILVIDHKCEIMQRKLVNSVVEKHAHSTTIGFGKPQKHFSNFQSDLSEILRAHLQI